MNKIDTLSTWIYCYLTASGNVQWKQNYLFGDGICLLLTFIMHVQLGLHTVIGCRANM